MSVDGSDADHVTPGHVLPVATDAVVDAAASSRKRKRKDKHEDLEEAYMERLEREHERAIQNDRAGRENKRPRTTDEAEDEGSEEGDEKPADGGAEEDEGHGQEGSDYEEFAADSEDDAMSPPPQHETLAPDTNSDLAKSQRTVFLANVSNEAISSKSARKTLLTHLASFFPKLAAPAEDEPKRRVESIRFRSTAYASAIPRKAAYAKKELMDATTKSTNAYAVYSSSMLAREAARRLNGTIVLDRHLRVDEVAHPAKTDHKRCVFVGGLAFVDDESNIDAGNDKERRKGKKEPGDVEEGLWRTFGKCGTVESVRVVRDSKTRVGKGFAYVQFADENAVEEALLCNEKRFPPLLPRKIRVMRAKSIKRNAKPGASAARAPSHTRTSATYNRKFTSEERSQMGRAGKLLGRAAAAQVRGGRGVGTGPNGVKAPESFVFEGHRASAKQGNTGLKLGGGGKNKKTGKPTGRGAKRGAAWKAGGGRKAK